MRAPATRLTLGSVWETWGRPITYSMLILKKSEYSQTSSESSLSRLLVCPTFSILFGDSGLLPGDLQPPPGRARRSQAQTCVAQSGPARAM